jgi:tRNA (mo5U34)-methyltransferase
VTLQSTRHESREISQLGPWFHNLHLPDGRQTAPDHPLGDFPRWKWDELAPSLPADPTGWTALDIGCNAGFYSFELAKRGAEVTGVDVDEHYLAQARWAARHLDEGRSVRFEQRAVYRLREDPSRYDLVLFLGVLYHLRYPLLGLDLVAEKARRLVVVQTLTMPGDDVVDAPEDVTIDERSRLLEPGWPKAAFIERKLANDATNWWAPNHAAVEAMLRSAGLEVVDRPGHEIYVCRPRGLPPDVAAELDATFR